MARAILITGDAGCGKGELADYIKEVFNFMYDVIDAQCKEHLHILTQNLFNVDPDLYWIIYEDRTQKETPNSLFRIKGGWHKMFSIDSCIEVDDDRFDSACRDGYIDLSLREAMIYVSECVVKPIFGEDYFGVVRAQKVDPSLDALYVDDSASAFLVGDEVIFEEVKPLKERIGAENIILVRITRPENPNVVGDSRKKIPDQPDIHTIDVVNENDKLGAFLHNTCLQIGEWLYGK